MKITLRKAHLIISQIDKILNPVFEIGGLLNKTNITTANIDIFSKDITKKIEDARDYLLEYISKKTDLINLKYNIRLKISKVNNTNNFDELMNQRKKNDLILKELLTIKRMIPSKFEEYNAEDISYKLEGLRNNNKVSSNEISINIITAEIVNRLDEDIKRLKSEIFNLSEIMETKNRQLSIELSQEELILLNKYNISY